KGMADRVGTLSDTLARFGADQTPEPVRKMRSANSARAELATLGLAKLHAGEIPTIREVEAVHRVHLGATRSQAEHAGRLFAQLSPGDRKNKPASTAILSALEALRAEVDSFTLKGSPSGK